MSVRSHLFTDSHVYVRACLLLLDALQTCLPLFPPELLVPFQLAYSNNLPEDGDATGAPLDEADLRRGQAAPAKEVSALL